MKRRLLEGIAFCVLASAWAHASYSRLGFNPTDEGYMLSASRRLLDGQVPHRDYITLRPPGTHLLHAHLLLWTGDRLLLWSRLVAWLELAAIAWGWLLLAEACFGPMPLAARLCGAFAALAAGAHTFPMMPWNTIDGTLFLTAGACLRLPGPHDRGDRRLAGAVLLGASVLFRQSFAPFVPALLLMTGAAREPAAWALAAAPGLLYAGFLAAAGAWSDAWMQLTSHRDSWTQFFAMRGHLRSMALPFLLALLGGIPAHRVRPGRPWERLAAAGPIAALLICLWHLADDADGARLGWGAFGAVLGLLPPLALGGAPAREPLRAALLALAVGWGVSVSEGWPTPALASGALVCVLLAAACRIERSAGGRPLLAGAGAAAALLVSLVTLDSARRMHVYRDLPAPLLRRDLGDALRGGRGILTGEPTHRLMSELRSLADAAARRGKRSAIVPEFAQFWTTSPSPNPLSCDWPCDAELAQSALRSRVLSEVDRAHGTTVFLVQKHWSHLRPFAAVPCLPGESAVRDHIRGRFRKVADGADFEVYE